MDMPLWCPRDALGSSGRVWSNCFEQNTALGLRWCCGNEFDCRTRRFLLVDNDGVYKGGFEAGFSSMPPDELPDPLPECAKELSCAYVSWT